MRLPFGILLTLYVITLSSCILTNRKYRPGFYVDKRVLYRINESGNSAALKNRRKESFIARRSNDLFTGAPILLDKPETVLVQSASIKTNKTTIHKQEFKYISSAIPIDTAIHEVGDKVIQKRASLSKEYGLLSVLTTLGSAGLGYLSLLILSISFFDILLIIGFCSFLIMTILLIIDCFKNAHYVRHSKWAHIDDKKKATFGMIMGIAALIMMLAFGGLLLAVLMP